MENGSWKPSPIGWALQRQWHALIAMLWDPCSGEWSQVDSSFHESTSLAMWWLPFMGTPAIIIDGQMVTGVKVSWRMASQNRMPEILFSWLVFWLLGSSMGVKPTTDHPSNFKLTFSHLSGRHAILIKDRKNHNNNHNNHNLSLTY